MSERLVPVGLDELKAGDDVEMTIRARVETPHDEEVDGELEIRLPAGGAGFAFIHPDAIKSVHRVDPELPTKPGAVIRCQIEALADLPAVASLAANGVWFAAGMSRAFMPREITRVLAVLDDGSDQ